MRRIQHCFDLSATPFAPTGKASTETGLYEWIVSDFGLNDAIETELVNTPRVVIRDNALPNAQTYRSRLYHLYREPEVVEGLNRRGAQPHESLPQLVQQAYTLLGADWQEAAKQWLETGHVSPPVMLAVCNRTETAARIEYAFRNGDAFWPDRPAPLPRQTTPRKTATEAAVSLPPETGHQAMRRRAKPMPASPIPMSTAVKGSGIGGAGSLM